MKFIWTKSTLLGGKEDLITWGLEEPCSHFAILFYDDLIFHSSLHGVDQLSLEEFLKSRVIVFEIDLPSDNEDYILNHLAQYLDHDYDWKFFWWLVWAAFKFKVFRIPLPDEIEIQQNGGILCTEVLNILPDEIIPSFDVRQVTTPYKLYKILKGWL